MKQTAYCAGILLLLASCAGKKTGAENDSYHVQGDTIVVNAASNLKGRLTVATVQSEPYRPKMLTAGTVKAIPTQFAEVAPPFSGRVLRSFTRLGMRVTPETPLFEISSPDFVSAQKQYFQARSAYELAMQTLKRQQDLMKHGVTSQKDLEETQTAFEVAKKEYENAVVSIRIFKADPDKLSLGQPLVVRAPIAGEVIDNRIVTGQFIRDDAASVATVAELSKVWVVGQVKEKDIRFIRELDACEIAIPALPEKQISGKVFHVNEMVDEATRSVQVLVECDNTGHTLKPGMYVTVNFSDTPVSAMLIPSKAVLQQNNETFVFAAVAPGKYVKRNIVTSGTDGDRVVVESGLQNGDNIVTAGGFYLLDAK